MNGNFNQQQTQYQQPIQQQPQQAQAQPIPEKKPITAGAIIKKAIFVLIDIIVIAIVIAIIYNNFFDPQRNLPTNTCFFSQEQIAQVPDFTVEEFYNKTNGQPEDKFDGKFYRITNLYTYGEYDADQRMLVAYGTDMYYPIVLQFYNMENMDQFGMRTTLYGDIFQAIGQVDYMSDGTIMLKNVMLLTDDLNLAYPDGLALADKAADAREG